jgi:hypothetical protein
MYSRNEEKHEPVLEYHLGELARAFALDAEFVRIQNEHYEVEAHGVSECGSQDRAVEQLAMCGI